MERFKKGFKSSANTFGIKAFIKNIGLSLLVFIGVFFISSILISLFLYNTPNPTVLLDIASYSSLFLSCLISCIFLSKKNGQKYLLGALLFGIIIVFALFAVSIFTDAKLFSVDSLLKLASFAFCILGGLLGVKREKRLKHKKHR